MDGRSYDISDNAHLWHYKDISGTYCKCFISTGTIKIVIKIKYYWIEGVAILVTLSYSVQYFIYFPFLKKEINLKYSDIWSFVKPTIISIGFTVALVSGSKGFMDASLSSFIQKLLLSILGYILFYNAITKWKLFKETSAMISSMRKQQDSLNV